MWHAKDKNIRWYVKDRKTELGDHRPLIKVGKPHSIKAEHVLRYYRLMSRQEIWDSVEEWGSSHLVFRSAHVRAECPCHISGGRAVLCFCCSLACKSGLLAFGLSEAHTSELNCAHVSQNDVTSQWLSNVRMCPNHPEGSLKCILLGLTPRASDSVGLGEPESRNF